MESGSPSVNVALFERQAGSVLPCKWLCGGGICKSLAEENIQLRKQLREQEKEIRRLNELNEFLGEASAFFAASRLKSGKTNE